MCFNNILFLLCSIKHTEQLVLNAQKLIPQRNRRFHQSQGRSAYLCQMPQTYHQYIGSNLSQKLVDSLKGKKGNHFPGKSDHKNLSQWKQTLCHTMYH